MGNFNFKTAEEFEAARAAYIKAHPDYSEPKPIECLNLVMKQFWAKKIIKGEKPLEFRNYSNFYISRLIDKKVAMFISDHMDEEGTLYFCNDIRPVKKIHFYDYGKTWYLDIECKSVDTFTLVREDIERLQKDFGVHDFDADLEYVEQAGIPEEERPMFFYLECGKVLSTNLKV